MALGSGWYYNSTSGAVIYQPPVLGLPQGLLPGWHGPFPTKAAADAYGNKLAAQGKGAKPTGFAGAVGNTAGAAASNATSAATGGLNDLASRLSQSHTWIRVGEAVAGFILIYVGAKAFFPQTVNTVASTAKTARKAAIHI